MKIKRQSNYAFIFFILILISVVLYLLYTHVFPLLLILIQNNIYEIIVVTIATVMIIAIILINPNNTSSPVGDSNNCRLPLSKEQQKYIINRAKGRCQWEYCKMTECLEFHHINSNPSDNNVNNIIYLCRNHHALADKCMRKQWQLCDWAKRIYH